MQLHVFEPERELVGFFDRLRVDGEGLRAEGKGSHDGAGDAQTVVLTHRFHRSIRSSAAPLSLQSWPSRRHTESHDGWRT